MVLLCSLSTLFGGGFDSDEELPSPLSSRPAYSLPDSEGYYSHGTKTHKYKSMIKLCIYKKHSRYSLYKCIVCSVLKSSNAEIEYMIADFFFWDLFSCGGET